MLHTYGTAMDICASAGQLDRALQVGREGGKEGRRLEEKVVLFILVSSNFHHFLTLPPSLPPSFPPQVASWMESAGLPLNKVAYTTLLKACAEAKQGERALEVLERLHASDVYLDYLGYLKVCVCPPSLPSPVSCVFSSANLFSSHPSLLPTELTHSLPPSLPPSQAVELLGATGLANEALAELEGMLEKEVVADHRIFFSLIRYVPSLPPSLPPSLTPLTVTKTLLKPLPV